MPGLTSIASMVLENFFRQSSRQGRFSFTELCATSLSDCGSVCERGKGEEEEGGRVIGGEGEAMVCSCTVQHLVVSQFAALLLKVAGTRDTPVPPEASSAVVQCQGWSPSCR